jgi:hypothetical protein
MADDSWPEYLEAAAEHLHATRQAVEHGATSPEPPAHPVGPLPEELAPRAQRLALAYDQLALEVSTHMAQIECRLAPPPRAETPPDPHYVDQRA